jgi:hypothetical protein
MLFEQWYIDQFRETLGEPLNKSDGISNAEIEKLTKGKQIPAAMRDYFRVAGRHWLNTNHNALHPLDSLDSVDGYTIFMDENQLVVQWAIHDMEMSDEDPIVYQGQQTEIGYEWYAEDLTFSRFMVRMWRWIITGEVQD